MSNNRQVNNYKIGFERSMVVQPTDNYLLERDYNNDDEHEHAINNSRNQNNRFEMENSVEDQALVAQEEDFESSVPNSPQPTTRKFIETSHHITKVEGVISTTPNYADDNLGDEVKLDDDNLGDEVKLDNNVDEEEEEKEEEEKEEEEAKEEKKPIVEYSQKTSQVAEKNEENNNNRVPFLKRDSTQNYQIHPEPADNNADWAKKNPGNKKVSDLIAKFSSDIKSMDSDSKSKNPTYKTDYGLGRQIGKIGQSKFQ